MNRRIFIATTGLALAAPFSALAPPPKAPADPAIAFAGQKEPDRGKLFVMNADGSNLSAIYSSPTLDSATPSWSPDGRSITFINGCDLWRIEVQVVNGKPKGVNPVNLYAGPPCVGTPAWSPLGHQIVVVFANSVPTCCDFGLALIPSTGGPAQAIYQAPDSSGLRSPTWSPDGTRIAFAKLTPPGSAVPTEAKILDLTTGVLTTAVALGSEWDINGVDWSRTGDRLAIGLSREDVTGQARIATVDLATGVLIEALVDPSACCPVWSPDDSKLLLAFSWRLKTLDLSTGGVQDLRRDGFWPDWRRF